MFYHILVVPGTVRLKIWEEYIQDTSENSEDEKLGMNLLLLARDYLKYQTDDQ
jgi:hypothetical protein